MATVLKALALTFIIACPLFAKDFGVVGHTFPIIEEDLLEYLKGRMLSMNDEDVQKMMELVKTHYIEMARHPNAVDLGQAREYRIFTYDPTITLSKDLYDHEGKLIVSGGSKVNPLNYVSLGANLLFFDGTNEKHLAWARRQPESSRWILTNGNPIDMEAQEGRAVYFDQYGAITEKFGIENIPARVSQEKNEDCLTIEEFPL